MNPRNTALAAGALAILATAGWLMFGRGNPEQAALPHVVRTHGVCLVCRQPATVNHATRDVAPFDCPACKAQAVYTRYYCNDCGKLFVPGLVRPVAEEPPRLPVVPVCAACGSRNSAGRNEHDPGQTIRGEAPLPPWP